MRHILISMRKMATCDFHIAVPEEWTASQVGDAIKNHGYQELAETRDLYDWEESAQYGIVGIAIIPPIEQEMSKPVAVFVQCS